MNEFQRVIDTIESIQDLLYDTKQKSDCQFEKFDRDLFDLKIMARRQMDQELEEQEKAEGGTHAVEGNRE